MRQPKLFLDDPGNRDGKVIPELIREDLLLVTVIITEHGYFNKYLHTLGLTDSDVCRGCGEEEETPLHLPSGP